MWTAAAAMVVVVAAAAPPPPLMLLQPPLMLDLAICPATPSGHEGFFTAGVNTVSQPSVPLPRLKLDDDDPVPSLAAPAGLKCDVHPQRNCPTLKPLQVYPNSSLTDCCARCAAFGPTCTAWTMDGENGGHPFHCFLNADCNRVMRTVANGSFSAVMNGSFPTIPTTCDDGRHDCAECTGPDLKATDGPCVWTDALASLGPNLERRCLSRSVWYNHSRAWPNLRLVQDCAHPPTLPEPIVRTSEGWVGRWLRGIGGVPNSALTDTPLAGNGYIGALLADGMADGLTPDAPAVSVWLNSNANWGCANNTATKFPGRLTEAVCSAVGLGGCRCPFRRSGSTARSWPSSGSPAHSCGRSRRLTMAERRWRHSPSCTRGQTSW